MSKKGFQSFAAGMILSTSVLAATYFMGETNEKTAAVVSKEVTENDIKEYLIKKGQTAIDTKEYDELIAFKETALIEKQKQAEAPPEEKPQNEKYTLKIVEGMNTGDVSDILEQEGVIASAKDFNEFVINGNYHTKVRMGTFELTKGMSFSEIVNVLVK
ncbi:hypothetical protein M4D55_10650 [Metabacillus idriensis]|uniref:Endolytic transglycosylase MltG n=1 Tax=Metabacillus idriensis TaxID=324768 RepID=A0A6I2MF82_9BACI|nr:hypothetical protein [Metabacillus idriensis]MCM3596232.1 hypothetical protein [Metabacillus idriensis]MRX56004.1 hypothetical protein [Metabacillus idriensis]OHR73952.1 hypothetical protein HMPREF3291_05045 [Bacillus sp. HMSC76G11]